jgi:hypothetical protein
MRSLLLIGDPPSATPAVSALLTRRSALQAGLALGVIALAGRPETAAAATQSGWRFCTKCRGLFFQGSGSSPRKKKKGKKSKAAGNASLGVCPAGGTHAPRSDLNYVLHLATSLETNPQLFKNFQQCTKCRGLFSRDIELKGVCPTGGAHASGDAPSSFFALWEGATVPGMDDAWDQCSKCRGIFNYAGGNAGSCPAGGGHVRSDANTRYTLFVLS